MNDIYIGKACYLKHNNMWTLQKISVLEYHIYRKPSDMFPIKVKRMVHPMFQRSL